MSSAPILENDEQSIYFVDRMACNEEVEKVEKKMKDVSSYMKSERRLYELIDNRKKPKEQLQRFHFDIDGSFNVKPPIPITEEEFKKLDNETYERIQEVFKDQKVAIATSSSFGMKKISWRIYLPELCGTRIANEKYAKMIAPSFDGLGENNRVHIDTGVYKTLQKLRCVGSSKETEKNPRPLLLKQGELEDTIVQFVPVGCEEYIPATPAEEQKKKREIQKKIKEVEQEEKRDLDEIKKRHSTLFTYIDFLTKQRIDDYNSWITLGLILHSKDIPLEIWEDISRKGDKYEPGVCQEKWKTFTKKEADEKKAGFNTILSWIKEDDPELYASTYYGMKEEFEKSNFKVMNPFQYVRIPPPSHNPLDSSKPYLQMNITPTLMYQNLYTADGQSFIQNWIKDKTIRTYEQLGFYPRKEDCPENTFNSFDGFAVLNMKKTEEVDLTRIYTQMKYLVGGNETYFEYLLKYIAYMFQFPHLKSQVALIFTSGQGAGKDTFWKFIGSLIGSRYSFYTSRPEDDLYGRFNIQSSQRLLILVQEMSRETFTKFDAKIKNTITDSPLSYEQKGMDTLNLPSYENYIFTTNEENPIFLEPGDRRMVIFKSNNPYATKPEYFEPLVELYNKESTKRAFYDMLMSIDLSNFNPKNRVITEEYKTAALHAIPMLFSYFRKVVKEQRGLPTKTFKIYKLITDMKEKLNLTKQLNDLHIQTLMKPLVQEKIIVKEPVEADQVPEYTLHIELFIEFLKKHNWWYDDL